MFLRLFYPYFQCLQENQLSTYSNHQFEGFKLFKGNKLNFIINLCIKNLKNQNKYLE